MIMTILHFTCRDCKVPVRTTSPNFKRCASCLRSHTAAKKRAERSERKAAR